MVRKVVARGLQVSGLDLHTLSGEISKHFEVYIDQNAVYNYLMMLSVHGDMTDIQTNIPDKQGTL